jgi:hypothetical protein
MNVALQILLTVLAAIISAIVGGFFGSLLTIAKFGSKIDLQAQSLNNFVNQRIEDRQNEQRENAKLREEFREFCAGQNTQRERELEFIRREFRDFRNIADRRQRYIMDVVTAIAAKEGITHRITDQLANSSGELDDGR